MNLKLHIWRQKSSSEPGMIVPYAVEGISPDSSFLEMLDLLNEGLIEKGEDPVAFDSDCREGICGMCSLVINGIPHGPHRQTTVCQLHMRHFKDGDDIWIEPWRAKAFPVLRDLIVDRSALDRIMAAGGFISARTGSAPDAGAIPVPKADAEESFEAAACIGCGACVASCKNASAMLFVGAKTVHLGKLPQGKPEQLARARAMVERMDAEGFGNCTNQYECEAVCPASVSRTVIASLNRDFLVGTLVRPF
ncbi:MAG: succinate dehydrogenase/fumarate reductase iron-sulfur subunit [Planctomycetota bacterium]|jgi:succinate dehydrogenase / fumarate reductase iron-sulfur subunit